MGRRESEERREEGEERKRDEGQIQDFVKVNEGGGVRKLLDFKNFLVAMGSFSRHINQVSH